MNIFQNGTKKLPHNDEQIVRVDLEENKMGGRKDFIPTAQKSDVMTIKHVEG